MVTPYCGAHHSRRAFGQRNMGTMVQKHWCYRRWNHARTPSTYPFGAARVIRVFASSTFRDIQAERDEQVKRIFPQLRKTCEARSVRWGEVDLCWGITDEQNAEGEVLPICIEEIRRWCPYFIGLLEERNGWAADEVLPALLRKSSHTRRMKRAQIRERSERTCYQRSENLR